MKKKMAKLIGFVWLGCMLLSGCGGSGVSDHKSSVENGYAFEVNGAKLYMDMDISTVIDTLGEPISYFEEPSCAVQGIAKIYTFAGYELTTYPDGKIDRIACIVLKDDSVATAENIDLSMTKKDVIGVYGKADETTDNSLVYRKDDMKIIFIFEKESVISIEYDSLVLSE